MPKFDVQKAEIPQNEGSDFGTTSQGGARKDSLGGHGGQKQTDDFMVNVPQDQDAHEETKKNLYLYEEDMKSMPRVTTFLKGVLNYQSTYPTEKETNESKKIPKKAKLGTVIGVYFPTIQHIFGVLMFVRLAWIVGAMGVIESFFMVLMCCITTFVTSISMSAIATNGMVQAGGSYFMISRNLGPECGGAVGICFYLANTFATDLYILGSVEIFLQYMAPSLAYFGDIEHNPWNNFRLYGTVVLLLLTLVVAVGVKFVSYFAPFSLACVIISIISIFIGSFEANAATRADIKVCLIGDRLQEIPEEAHANHVLNMTTYLNKSSILDGSWCSNDTGGVIYARYCPFNSDTNSVECADYWNQYSHTVRYVVGIPGMASGIIKDNAYSHYLKLGEAEPGVRGNVRHGEVVCDFATSFVTLCAIYFPSVTGIMTGSNMSGDLRDPQQSIPIGTILAQLTCSFVYLSFVLLFGSTTEGHLLRDKFGLSIGGALLAAEISWPHKWVVLVGAFCSTIGAALQCITSAPRLLQAISRDGIVPFLQPFAKTTKQGEPLRALILTALIAEIGIVIASLDYVAHVIDVFFLMCYGFVNLACALLSLLDAPSWRPRFKYYHWTLAILGVALNLALSFIAGWYYALAAFCIAVFFYKYVEYKGGEREWGDGITGFSMSAAQGALLRLEEGDPHTKNWRPQLLVLCKVNPDLTVKYQSIINLASQLKAGKGLTILAAVLKGDYHDHAEDAVKLKEHMKSLMSEDKMKGFAKVMCTRSITEGLNIFIQTTGLGGLRHNTVMIGWPYGWKHSHEERSWKIFLETVRAVQAKGCALLVPRNVDNFPTNHERMENFIDVWWIVHDGGMLILLSFLLKQHKVWKNCSIRIFTVAQISDNSIQLKKDLESFLYQLRINAEVFVEEMYDGDISAYTVERTLDMEKRAKMLKEIKLGRRGTELSLIQELVDNCHRDVSGSDTSLQGGVSSRSSISRKQSSADPETEAAAKSTTLGVDTQDDVHFTFTPGDPTADKLLEDVKAARNEDASKGRVEFSVSTDSGERDNASTINRLHRAGSRYLRMHTAVRLNQTIRSKSARADLVILNFPAPPAKLSAEENYMEYLEVLTDGINRVLMVRGSGMEVVTIFN